MSDLELGIRVTRLQLTGSATYDGHWSVCQPTKQSKYSILFEFQNGQTPGPWDIRDEGQVGSLVETFDPFPTPTSCHISCVMSLPSNFAFLTMK